MALLRSVTTFGERLKALRLQRGETQPELAEAVATNAGTVSRWERDDGKPHVEQLLKLREHFGVTLDFLLLGEPHDEHPVSLPEFDTFLASEYGRIAEKRGYVRALLALRYPFPPTARLYKALVATMMLEDDETPR